MNNYPNSYLIKHMRLTSELHGEIYLRRLYVLKKAVSDISIWWLEVTYNPKYKICQKKLLENLKNLSL